MTLDEADRRRVAMVAHQARCSRNAKTSLNLAIRHLEGAQSAALKAEQNRRAATLARLIRESTDLLQGWPTYERAAS